MGWVIVWNLFGWGFPGGSDSKASARNAGDLGSIPGSGRSPGEGNGNPLQYSCLENPVDRGAWWATVHGVAESRTRLSDLTSLHFTLVKAWKGEVGSFLTRAPGYRAYSHTPGALRCLPFWRAGTASWSSLCPSASSGSNQVTGQEQ